MYIQKRNLPVSLLLAKRTLNIENLNDINANAHRIITCFITKIKLCFCYSALKKVMANLFEMSLIDQMHKVYKKVDIL